MHLNRPRAATLLTLIILAGCAASSCKSSGARRGPYPSRPIVDVVTAERRSVPIYRQYLGQTAAINPVEIRPQVTGLLRSIDFKEGSVVKSGQLLFTIDPRSYQAALDQAQAKLAQARAALIDDRADLARDRVLFRRQVLSAQQLDSQIAQTHEAEANVKAAQAAAATAALNLSYTKIHAPIAGRIGMALVKVGALVQQDTTLLDTIYSIDPIYVDFSVSEAGFLNYEQDARSDGAGGSSLELSLPNGAIYPHRGRIVMASPTVDAATGTLKMRAQFPNPDGLLRPGLLVQVKTMVRRQTNAVMVPEAAVQQDQGQDSVYVVGAGDKAEFRSVKPGPAVDHMRIIESGVKAGDRVIVAGAEYLRPGMTVTPRHLSAPHPAPGPRATASR